MACTVAGVDFLTCKPYSKDWQSKSPPLHEMATTTARLARSAVAAAAPLPAIRGQQAMWAPVTLRQRPAQQRRAAATLVVRATADTEAAGEAFAQASATCFKWDSVGHWMQACNIFLMHRHWLPH